MIRLKGLLILLLVAATFACATKKSPSASNVGKTDDQFVLSGQTLQGHASWYGPGFHGRRTANGEIFNKYALTAAHKTLPFGTILEITNPETDKTIRVRINDRGPFVKGRILDLSQKAAQELGFMLKGATDVIAKVLLPADIAAASAAAESEAMARKSVIRHYVHR